ncbi:FAD-dependent monooxygenase [Rheinheimera sp. UJ51]|uniref:FAD-dependent monooxygenase n=1 Tax=Rheinheimera sp. UJ51 TaxID=2892446 RepID=UPI001E34476D|nr:FAD-dependent monooxygenase [Rheinheimera sp. UJ51]MCC5451051.1 FAD-dependent monooxygenase [Rheinheimera sp. UJ51]
MQNLDITIVGGGSAGLTLALLLAPLGLKIALVEQGAAPTSSELTYQRVSALNPASMRLLSHLGVADPIMAQAAAYSSMAVWEADSFGRIEFSAEPPQLPQLGWICDNEGIRQQLYQQLQTHNNVQCFFQAKISQLAQTEREVLVQLASGDILLSQLLVGADGVNSFVRQQQQLPLTHWDYQQQAIVARIHCQEPHQGVARQVFLPTGPLALLPLPDAQQCSIVWSADTARAEQLLALDNHAFNQALTAASQSALGCLTLTSERHNFPLTMRYASEWVRGRVVLVADAAHSIHPLAGQGMNLGLMDVAALAQIIEKQLQSGKALAEPRALLAYQRWRKAEAQSMIATMEAFKRGFSNKQPALKLLRGAGLLLADKLPGLKQKLMAAALGNSGDLPDIAKY